MTRPERPDLRVGDVVRVGRETRTVIRVPIWVDTRWRVLTRGEDFEQYVDTDKLRLVAREG